MVAENQNQMVAERCAEKVGDGSAAREADSNLGAAKIFRFSGSQDFTLSEPNPLHLFAADAQQGDRARGKSPLNPNAQSGLEVRT